MGENTFLEIIVKLAKNTKQELQSSLSAMKGLWVQVKAKLNKSESKAEIKKGLAGLNGLNVNVKGKLDKKSTNQSIKEQAKSLNDIYLNANVTLDKKKAQKQIDKDLAGIVGEKKNIKLTPVASTADRASASIPKSNGFHFTRIKDSVSAIFGLEGTVRRFIKLIGDATRQLKAVDTQMTEISKTANLTEREMLELGNAAFDSANKFGRSVNQYLEGANTFAQAGKKNVAALAELSLMAQSAGNMEASLADEYLLATDAAYGFQGSVEKLTQVLDGQNQVTNRNAVDMSKIAEATKITGSQAAQSGVEIDEMTAAISTMIAVTQMSGSEVGRAFKGIQMNLQKVKGEVADGEIIDEEALSKSEKALQSVGISLKEMHNGILTLRNPMEVIKELSATFMALDENDARRANIIESIGGKYRGNQLTALLSNYEMYEKILADYKDSTGSALRESQKTANSWEGLQNQLSNSWIEFVGGFVNTDWVKGGMSGLNSMVQALDGLNKAGMFIPALTGSVVALQAALNKNYGITQFHNKATGKIDIQGNMFGVDFTAMAKQKQHFSDAQGIIADWNAEIKAGTADISSFGGELVKNNEAFKTYLSTTKNGNASLAGYKASLNAAGISTDALRLKTVALNAVLGMGIGLAIQGVIMGVQALADAHVTLAEQQEKVAEAAENYAAVQSNIASLNSELKTTNDRISELNKQDDLTLLEKDELSNLKESNAELATRIALLEKEEQIEAKKLGEESVRLFDRQFGDETFSDAQVDEYQSNAKWSGNNAILHSDENDISAMIAAYKQYAELREQANNPEDAQRYSDTISEIEEKLLASANTLQTTKENLSALSNPSEEQLAIIEKSKTGLDMINSLIMPEKWKSIKFNEIFNSNSMDSTKEKLMELSQQGQLDEDVINSYGDFSSQLANAKITASEAVTEINALNTVVASSAMSAFSPIIDSNTESFKNLNTQLDSIQSAYKTFTSAIDEYNQTGTLSLDTTQAILALGDEYIGYLFDENNQLQLNKEGFIALANAKLNKLEADALAAAIDNVRGLTDEATATEYLKGKTNEATIATEKNTIAELENLAVKKAAEGGNLKLATEQITATFNQYKSVIDATRAGLGSYTDATMGATSATKELEEAQEKAEDSLRAEGDAAIRVIDKEIKAIQDKQKAYEKGKDEEIKATTEEKEAFTEAIDEKIEQTQKEKDSFKETVDANIEAIRKEREEYQKAIDAELEALNERKEALEESIKKGEDAASVVVDLIQEQMNAIDKQKDEVNKFYDEQLDALDKVNKELQDQIALEDALEAREKAKSQKLLVYRKGEGFVPAENEGAVKDAQDNLDQVLADQALQAEKDRLEEERKEKLEALDAEKKLLEEYQKLWGDATSKYEEEMRRKHALAQLGQGYEQAILEQRTDILDKFTQFHYDQTVELEENVLTQIDTLTKQKEEELEIFDQRLEGLEEYRDQELKIYDERLEALNLHKENELKIFEDHIKALQEQKEREAENYAERIEDLNGYKEQIQDQLSMIGQTWEDHEADMKAVERWEAALYDNMAGAIEDYADRVEDAMRRANDAKESGGVSSGGFSGAPDKSPTYTPSDDYYDKKHDVDKDRLNKLATGGVVTEPGWFITDEDGKKEVKVRPKAGKATLLDKGDMVFPHGTSVTMSDDALQKPKLVLDKIDYLFDYIKSRPDFRPLPLPQMPQMKMYGMPINNHNTEESVTIRIDKVDVHSDNVDQFLDSMMTIKNDALQKRRKF